MKTDNRNTIPAWAKLMAPICLVACLTVIVSLGLPYKSLGGGTRGKVEVEEEPSISEIPIHMKLATIRGRVYSIHVAPLGDTYVAEVHMLVDNHESIGNHNAVLIVPAARVQRIFELAMAREITMEAFGYKISPPAGTKYGGYPFYKIANATIYDSGLIALSTVIG